jgi:translation initiation factor 1
MSITPCSDCGLPDELCVCENDVEQKVELTIETEERQYNTATLVRGFDADVPEEVASDLKNTLACGGSADAETDGSMMLQGEHVNRATEELEKKGYSVTEKN